MSSIIRPLDLESLRRQYESAAPFPYIMIDNFLAPEFAEELMHAYPTYEDARGMGKEFNALNERLKIQVTDRNKFPERVREMSDAISSREFLRSLENITSIPNLKSDDLLAGGGMHLTGPGGRLDVHVDFNYLAERNLHRRLNILIYLNSPWSSEWGGNIELWDRDVRHCAQSFTPILNRCVLFETNEISYHGVTPVSCPAGILRKSFAAYYYTSEAPAGWDGSQHSTIFKARPSEVVRGAVLMPARDLRDRAEGIVSRIRRSLSRLVK